ncbi:MAG: LexA repressor [Leptospirillum sp. Group II 'C75']|jgi:repressor LexA|uniref:LexA repressor n=2 Tax=Leptospirillum ferriphilum TaxID=178606 RepID=A0A1V3ST41_9BACT|nr:MULTISPECIES: transcriptional repressor LexA [Leptospirillum]EAY57311.1 MAG: LexA repressor [Leptospirillum rubarum]EIJ77400.1 MAG: LexA repressor [Leptospirillum sp. Group II 'C75']AFS53176.1 SOS-response transcriptional repressor,LexA [Leptospirillum ferriphilum ML-04]AKS23837.1 SOS-response transcriptional repressor,LexA [Leptospirillum sp. Group II 'CF-1']OOH70638.1 repressor LexA [Leptospirillum ferriphilum]
MRETKALTSRQREVFEFILKWMRETRLPPTLSEVAQFLGVPYPKSAATHLDALEKKGFIQRSPGKARGILLTPLGESYQMDRLVENIVEIPIVGRIRAGRLTGSEIVPDGTLAVPLSLFSEKPDFVLQIRGDSMNGAGILDGDMAFIRKTREARNGDLIVAHIQGEMTLKQLIVEKRQIILRAANPLYADIRVSPDDEAALVQGKMIGLFRDQRTNGGRNWS